MIVLDLLILCCPSSLLASASLSYIAAYYGDHWRYWLQELAFTTAWVLFLTGVGLAVAFVGCTAWELL